MCHSNAITASQLCWILLLSSPIDSNTHQFTDSQNVQSLQSHLAQPIIFENSRETTLNEFNTFYQQCKYEKSVEIFKNHGELINTHNLAVDEIR